MSKVTASDGWTCRVDVVRVGVDLRVRPQSTLRFDEDGRTTVRPYKSLYVSSLLVSMLTT